MARILITGGNRGIGLELIRQWRERGEEVIAAVRNASDALAATGAEVHTGFDVSDEASVKALRDALAEREIDLLVNCAGVLSRESLEDLSFDRIRQQMEINAFGPLHVTHGLLDRLAAGAGVVIISSRMGSIADNDSGGMYGYRMSKAAVNAAGRSLAMDLRERGIPVLLLHPGMVATDMTGGRGIPVEESARGLIARMDGMTLEQTGSFWHQSGEQLPW